MAETKKKLKKKKITISEEDISLLFRRYNAATIVALLQEVAQCHDAKIDWNELASKTNTGITNAREYQMVWRYLAYRDALLEKVDEGVEPMDDDSDLECDLEAFPPVSGEASAEAAACAKVLLGFDLPSDAGLLNCATVEAPMTINIPNGQAPSVDPENSQTVCTKGKNITVPVSVTSTEVEGTANGVLRKKRKPWTEEEDMELIAAVQKCGERNWANILKGDFKGDRTASQLSQRWAIIRKRMEKLNPGGSNPLNSQLTEAQLATRRAVSHALNMPMMDNFVAAGSSGATHASTPSSSAAIRSGPEDSLPGTHSQQAPQQKVLSNLTSKSRSIAVAAKKGPAVPFKALPGPNPMIQATAVAAGARIATPSTAASLYKAAQSKNVVHIRPGGSSMFKTSVAGVTKPSQPNHIGSRPNVHYIRTGLAPATAPVTYSGPSPSIPQPVSTQQDHGNPTRPHGMACSITPTSSTFPAEQMAATSSGTLCGTNEREVANAISTVDTEPLSKQGIESAEKMKDEGFRNAPGDIVHGQTNVSNLEVTVENQPHDMGAGENEQFPISNRYREL